MLVIRIVLRRVILYDRGRVIELLVFYRGCCIYKLQAYRTRTLESEFCMGGQIRIDNLPYKSFIPVLSCTVPIYYQRIVTSGISY